MVELKDRPRRRRRARCSFSHASRWWSRSWFLVGTRSAFAPLKVYTLKVAVERLTLIALVGELTQSEHSSSVYLCLELLGLSVILSDVWHLAGRPWAMCLSLLCDGVTAAHMPEEPQSSLTLHPFPLDVGLDSDFVQAAFLEIVK